MKSPVDSIRWLTFRLGTDQFAINISHVRELVPLKDVTIVRPPEMPVGIEGVAQVRDQTIGVVDLRTLLGMPSIREETDKIIKMLDEREQDHIHWLAKLEESIQSQEDFTLAIDPHQCTFGRWYDQLTGDRTRLDSFTNSDLALTEVVERFDLPHTRIHGIAQQVTALIEDNRPEEAKQLIEQTRATDLSAMVELFGRCREIFRELRRGLLIIIEHEDVSLGALVDSVNEVTSFKAEDVDDIPIIASGIRLVSGIAKSQGDHQMIQLLDVAAIAAHGTQAPRRELAASL